MTAVGGTSPTQRADGGRLGTAVLAILVLVAASVAMTTAGAAQTGPDLPDEPAFIVLLEPDGSARMVLTVTFDLSSETSRDAFDAFRENATLREQRAEQFAVRLRTIALRAEANTDREMGVGQPTIQFVERGDTGIVAFAVRWEGLAARAGDRLVLGEPFASGFSTDRPFRVVAPTGYQLDTVTPSPTTQSETTAAWAPGTSFDEFEVTFVPTSTSDGATSATTSAEAPGFGLGVAVVAILLIVAFRYHRGPRRSN